MELHTRTTILPVRSPWWRLQLPEARPTCSRASSRTSSPSSSDSRWWCSIARARAPTSAPRASRKPLPDGYTLLLGSIANTLNPHIMRTVGYRLEDFAPMSSVAAAADVLVVHPSTAANERPGADRAPQEQAGNARWSCRHRHHAASVAGNSSAAWPASRSRWCRSRAAARRSREYSARQVPFMFSTTIGILPFVRSGQLRALAVSSAKRIAAAPELPTVAESGLPGFDVVAWFGLFAPAGTPKPIVDRLSAETRAALAAPDVRKLPGRSRRRAPWQHARSVCRLRQRRVRALGQADQGSGHQPRLNER